MAKVFIPTPGDDFLLWANNLANEFTSSTVPVALSIKDWREWATHFLLANPSFSTFPLPLKSIYPEEKDWKKWAEFFVNNLYTL